MKCKKSHMMVEQFEVAFVNGTADIFSIFYRCSRCRKGLIHDYTRTTSMLLTEEQADKFEAEHEPNKYRPIERIYNEDEDKGESTPNPQPDKSSE
jgi:uncharacterized metal-binding protein YceD (DUF177 family)|tara:strand:+ start:7451 stop:7735 length:285 start_codon:yes stop_codon:yes gene_type:complete